jgi:predicted MFS family arabinose efflux permease
MSGLWRHGEFRKLWIGQTISEFGSRITREGLPLTAVLVLHATPAQMGLLAGAGALGAVLVGLPAGVWVDRLRRRPLMIVADIGRALLLGSVPLAFLWGVLGMAQLYAVATLAGMLTVLFEVAYQSYLPVLVERQQVLEGNSKLLLSSAAAEIAGPGVTGFLVQWITAPIAILFDAVSFLCSAALLALMRKVPEPRCEREPEAVWREMGEGLRTVAGDPLLRALGARAATAALFFGFLGGLYVLFAIRDLGLNPAMLGLTIAVGGVGAVGGAMIAEKTARAIGTGPTLIAAALVTGVAAFLVPMAHGPLPVAVAFLMTAQLGDASFAVYNINELSLRQTITPDHLLGRVNSVMNLLFRGIYPLGALIGGVLADAIGVRATLAIGAAGVLLSTACLVLSPVRRLRCLPVEVH